MPDAVEKNIFHRLQTSMMMNQFTLPELAERWINNELTEAERSEITTRLNHDAAFNREFTELLLVLQQLNRQGELRSYKSLLHTTANKVIPEFQQPSGKLIRFWQKNKKTIAVAASIAIIVSVGLSITIQQLNPTKNNHLRPLVEKLKEQDVKYRSLESQLGKLKRDAASSNPLKTRLESKFRATGFMIDVHNQYLITNAHVIREADHRLVVENRDGDQFTAEAVYINPEHDLAILQIKDPNFKSLQPIPYTFKKEEADLGESVFILGFPKQEIVYGEGYLSALNGYDMDPVYYQLNTLAKDGHSGSPVITKQGELIGVISSKEANGEGVAFAIKSTYIMDAIREMKKMEEHPPVLIQPKVQLRKIDRKAQIKKVQDYIFMVKGN
jgi:serine protease Do